MASRRQNTALVFIKPHAVNGRVEAFLQEHLAANNVQILQSGTVSANDIKEEGIIDKHYAVIANIALELFPAELTVSPEKKAEFEEVFGVGWDKTIEDGKLFNLRGFQDKFRDLDSDAIERKWRAAKPFKLGPGNYVGYFKDEKVYVVNAFYSQMRQTYIRPKASVMWFTVQFDEATLSWKRFRSHVIGATDPRTAEPGSLRRKIFEQWQKLQLPAEPDTGDNGIHASADPIAGLRERMIWQAYGIEDDPLGKALLSSGVTKDFLKKWLTNSMCEIGGKKGLAFDLLEDRDTSEVMQLAYNLCCGKPQVVFVLGGPGAGKGTQCARIATEFGFIMEGKIVPVEITVNLLLAAMEKSQNKKFLIDGFPRSMDNKDGWYKIAGDKVDLAFCLFFDCPEEEMEKRLMKRSATNARDDDNVESIKKRFQTFQQTSMPVVDWFLKRGMLRTISSIQSVEEVWAATKRVFNSLAGNQNSVINTALVFIKPHAVNGSVKSLVERHFSTNKVKVIVEGTLSSSEIKEKGIIDDHFRAIAMNAVKLLPSELTVSPESLTAFEEEFGIRWSKVIKENKVLNLAQFQAKFPALTVDAIEKKWRAKEALKLGPGNYVGYFEVEKVWVVNAFYGQMREKYTKPNASVIWYVVQFEVEALSWKRFRSSVIGGTDPSKAEPGSLRRKMYDHWQTFRLSAEPDTGDNGVHASAGPIEGLRERLLWLGISMSDDPLGEVMLESGVKPEVLEKWCSNEVVEIGGARAPAFDLLEDKDSSEVIRLAVQASR